ncbi:MAG: hypothetical protein ACK5VI_10720 [Opitutia bacterium]|jgi:hypothetical protein
MRKPRNNARPSNGGELRGHYANKAGKLYASPLMSPNDLFRWRLAQASATGKVWTQQDAADWAGVSHRHWRRYEQGDTAIPHWLLNRISERDAYRQIISKLTIEKQTTPP